MSVPLYEKIYKQLLERIIEGEFKEGDRVPSEQELATDFNVSRITSKKALDVLSEHGVIERIRGKGSFVKNDQPNISLRENSQDNNTETYRSLILGLIVPEFFDSYGSNLVKNIERACSKLDIHLVLKLSYGFIEEEAKCITAMSELGVDGLIIIPVHGQHYNNNLLQLVLNKFPIVFADRYLKGIPANSVCIDNSEASTQLTEHLIQLGHKNIAFISPPLTGASAIEDRLKGYQMAFSYQGLKLNTNYILSHLRSSLPASVHSKEIEDIREDDYRKIKKFMSENPEVTSFVVCDYKLAILIYDFLKEENKAVPDDYSIVCFDFPESCLSDFKFTHIKQDEKMMANESIDLLLKQINGNDLSKQVLIKHRIIEGSTCKAINS